MARDSLDEWIYFLKHQKIKGNFQARGLRRAKEVLGLMTLGDQERWAYEWHMEELSYQASMYQSSYYDGRLDGEKEGMEKGREAGRKARRKKPWPWH